MSPKNKNTVCGRYYFIGSTTIEKRNYRILQGKTSHFTNKYFLLLFELDFKKKKKKKQFLQKKDEYLPGQMPVLLNLAVFKR